MNSTTKRIDPTCRRFAAEFNFDMSLPAEAVFEPPTIIKMIPTMDTILKRRRTFPIRAFSLNAGCALKCLISRASMLSIRGSAYMVDRKPIVATSRGDKPAPSKTT